MQVVPRWIFVINMKKFSMTLHRPFKKKKICLQYYKTSRVWLGLGKSHMTGCLSDVFVSLAFWQMCSFSQGKSTLCCSYITGEKQTKKRITCLVILNVFEDLFCGFLRARSSSPTFSRKPLNETKKMRQTYHQSIINMSVSFYILLLTVNKPVATNPDYFFFSKLPFEMKRFIVATPPPIYIQYVSESQRKWVIFPAHIDSKINEVTQYFNMCKYVFTC